MNIQSLKHIFISLSIIPAFWVSAQSGGTSGMVVYKTDIDTYLLESIYKKDSILRDMYQTLLNKKMQINEIARDFRYILKFNPNESLYYWEEEIPDETVGKRDFMMAVLQGGGFGKHYVNKTENLYMRQFKSPLDHKWYRETQAFNTQHWVVTPETDTILGYKVYKAVSGNATAWFTPEITVPFGPAGKGNLPGLILKWQYNARIIYADRIKIYKKPLPIKRPQKGILRSFEEGKKIRIRQVKKLTGEEN